MNTFPKFVQVGRKWGWNKLLAKSAGMNRIEERSLLGHSLSVSSISFILAEYLKLSEKETNLLVTASFLHDMGKEEAEWQRMLLDPNEPHVRHLKGFNEVHDKIQDLNINFNEHDELAIFCIIASTHAGPSESIAITKTIAEIKKNFLNYVRFDLLFKLAQISDALGSAVDPWTCMRISTYDRFAQLFRKIEDKEPPLTLYCCTVSVTRGLTTTLTHEAVQNCLIDYGFKPLVYFPIGTVFVGRNIAVKGLDLKIRDHLAKVITKLTTTDEQLKSAFSFVINKRMVGAQELVSSETIKTILEFAQENILAQKKDDNQKRALLIRFLFQLQQAFYNNLVQSASEKAGKFLQEFERLEFDFFGMSTEKKRHTQQYSPYIPDFEKILQMSLNMMGQTRPIASIPLEMQFKFIINQIIGFHSKFSREFNDDHPAAGPQYKTLIDSMIKELVLFKESTAEMAFEVSLNVKKEYYDQKKNLMRKTSQFILCPICGQPYQAKEAIAAAVGRGTKKFMNKAIGTTRLNKINLCELCIFEGFLRKSSELIMILSPRISYSLNEAETVLDLVRNKFSRLSDNPWLISERILSDPDNFFKELSFKTLEMIYEAKKAKRRNFSVPDILSSNYFIIFPNSYKGKQSDSNFMLQRILTAITIGEVFDMDVSIQKELSILDFTFREGAVNFPGSHIIYSTLRLHNKMILLGDTDRVAKRIAAGIYIKVRAGLSDKNGVIEALKRHPGQILARIGQNTERIYLNKKDIISLEILGEKNE